MQQHLSQIKHCSKIVIVPPLALSRSLHHNDRQLYTELLDTAMFGTSRTAGSYTPSTTTDVKNEQRRLQISNSLNKNGIISNVISAIVQAYLARCAKNKSFKLMFQIQRGFIKALGITLRITKQFGISYLNCATKVLVTPNREIISATEALIFC